MVSPVAIGLGSAAGSAVLGLWLARYRSVGPQSLQGAMAACGVAVILLAAVGPAMRWVVASSGGPAALLAVADPIFVFAFWSGGALIRAFAGTPRPD
jgi:hypothetical protein